MEYSISAGNSKMGTIPSFNLMPGITCSAAAKITYYTHGCYAVNDLRYPRVRAAWSRNTEGAMNDLPGLYSCISQWLSIHKPRFFRIHSSGDFCSLEYATMWMRIALEHPETKFLAFTKQFEIVRGVDFSSVLNFSLVLSSWNGHDIPEDLEKLYPVAYCDDGNIDIISSRPVLECPGNCKTCGFCWNLQQINHSVKFCNHGTKKTTPNE